MPAVFPELPNGDAVRNIWNQFLEIYKLLRSRINMTTTELASFKQKTKDWLTAFLAIYQTMQAIFTCLQIA